MRRRSDIFTQREQAVYILQIVFGIGHAGVLLYAHQVAIAVLYRRLENGAFAKVVKGGELQEVEVGFILLISAERFIQRGAIVLGI